MGSPCGRTDFDVDWMFYDFYFFVEFVVANISIVYLGLR